MEPIGPTSPFQKKNSRLHTGCDAENFSFPRSLKTMAKLFWFTTCRLCEQGRLFIYWNCVRETPYLHCEECEWGWNDPSKLAPADGFLTVEEEDEARAPTQAELEKAGWVKFALHEV